MAITTRDRIDNALRGILSIDLPKPQSYCGHRCAIGQRYLQRHRSSPA
jgi:hypothetical protein